MLKVTFSLLKIEFYPELIHFRPILKNLFEMFLKGRNVRKNSLLDVELCTPLQSPRNVFEGMEEEPRPRNETEEVGESFRVPLSTEVMIF